MLLFKAAVHCETAACVHQTGGGCDTVDVQSVTFRQMFRFRAFILALLQWPTYVAVELPGIGTGLCRRGSTQDS